MNSLTDKFIMSNGYGMPCLGYGTWQAPDDRLTVDGVISAINCGYRHIDTAAVYGNEKSVGTAIKESGINRSDLFVTSKVHQVDRGYEKTKLAFQKTLDDLQLDYLDLYLIHWPANSAHNPDNWEETNLSTWSGLVELYKKGYIKSIGVSNFHERHLAALLKTEVKPMCNQIEYHPGCTQDDIIKACEANNILVTAWSPLGNGELLKDETLGAIAKKYNKTTAQLCLRYVLQKGVVPLTKSVHEDRIKSNADIFDFNITAEDMALIDQIPTCGTGWTPENVAWS